MIDYENFPLDGHMDSDRDSSRSRGLGGRRNLIPIDAKEKDTKEKEARKKHRKRTVMD